MGQEDVRKIIQGYKIMENKKYYAYIGCAVNNDDIFWDFDYKHFKHPEYKTKTEQNKNRKSRIFRRMFAKCFRLVLEDVVENNATFILPTGRKKSNICMDHIDKEQFIHARKNGKCMNIDFLKSNYKMYFPKINLTDMRNMSMKSYPIVAPKDITDKIIEYTNKGRRFY